jgi:glycine dehydrogenase subunit 1
MDAANTSMYDGATALGEASLMAKRINRKTEIIVPKAMSWEKKSVLRNYCSGPEMKVKEVAFDSTTGKMDLGHLTELVTEDTSAVYTESPNFFGVIEDDLAEIRRISEGKVLIAGMNPLALAVLKPPGDFGFDIVVGEGQSLGLPLNFGGPLLGIFACRKEHLRKMPGRVVGLTRDRKDERAFCLTLQAREQHIRRDKATSNICTNESLCALASAVHISIMGGRGLQETAVKNMEIARHLMNRINELEGFKAPLFKGHHFNEFVVGCGPDYDVEAIRAHLLNEGIQVGSSLKDKFPGLGESFLIGATEMIVERDIDKLIGALEVLR